jgi:hypothetical protein
MKLVIDVQGADGPVLNQVADRVDNLEPALLDAADTFRSREQQVFATAAGGSWDPLDPSTVKRKGSSRVLVDDGGLLRSLTVRGDRYHVERVTPDELLVGTRNPVAHLHRDGARGMPRRDPVPPTTAAERAQFTAGLLDFIVDEQS